ncbi:MAG: tetratricopeptide repeat protein [Desulfosalsimonadaceae bacterium]
MGRNLRRSGKSILNDKAFLKEIEYDLREYLWKRLVDEDSSDSLKVFSQLRIAVPKKIIKSLSTEYSMKKGISSGLLFEIHDPFWNYLVDGVGILRLRQIEDGISSDLDEFKHKDGTFEPNDHKKVAQLYNEVFSEDDDPKWLRESYYHRILSGDDNFLGRLGDYYWHELCNSASYIFKTKKDYELSLKLLNHANEIRPLLRYSRMHRASCLVRVGYGEEGLKEYTALFNDYPDKIGVKTSYVDALLYKHRFNESIIFLSEHNLKPDLSPWIAGQWGRAYLGENNYSKALECFFIQKKISYQLSPFIFVNIAIIYRYMGRIEAAFKVIEEGLNTFHFSDSLKLLKGSTLEILGNNDEAYEILQPLFMKVPHSPDVVLPLIKVLLKKNDLHNAKRILAKCRDLNNSHSPILITAEAEILKRYDPIAAITLLKTQSEDDQHNTGMILEAYCSAALAATTSKNRIELAEEGLELNIPESLFNNAMIVINICRLSILANNYSRYSDLIGRLIDMEVEEYEISKLISLYEQFNPNQKA